MTDARKGKRLKEEGKEYIIVDENATEWSVDKYTFLAWAASQSKTTMDDVVREAFQLLGVDPDKEPEKAAALMPAVAELIEKLAEAGLIIEE